MKQVISFGVAVCFSFFLFIGMFKLIDKKAIAQPNQPPTMIDMFIDIKNTPPKPFERTKPPKIEPVKDQPQNPSTKPQKVFKETFKVANASGLTEGFKNSINPTFSPNGLIGLDKSGENGNSELTPKIAIEPMYPPIAAREGKEGYVTLSFDITTTGETSNIQVIDSEPKGYFEQSAKKALRKWQYSAKRENGKAVEVLNQSVTLAFKLES